MSETLTFIVPGEPRGKGRPRFVSTPSGGRAFTDQQTVSYERMIAWCAKQAGAVPVETPVRMRVLAYLQIPTSASKKRQEAMASGVELPAKKPDADNLIKALMDGLNGVAFRDDVQVCELTFSKFWSREPRLEVTISPIAAADAVPARDQTSYGKDLKHVA